MTEKIRAHILAVRDTGLTNMFDLPTVQRIATQLGFFELASYLSDGNVKEYAHFILTG